MMRLFILVISMIFYIASIAQNSLEKKGWELTFNDEFNGEKLDDKKWQDYPSNGVRAVPGGLTYYGKDQFRFSDSTIIIVTEKKEEKAGIPYASGMMGSNKSFNQQYGYFEIRCKIPNSTGFWPAFWLVSAKSWPPEIDVFEFYTNNRNYMSTTQHWLNKSKKYRRQSKKYKIADASKKFHTYAIEWTSKKIVWYYDNKKIRKSRRGTKFFTQMMYIIINVEISDRKDMKLADAIFPNTYEIDYVRAYKRK